MIVGAHGDMGMSISQVRQLVAATMAGKDTGDKRPQNPKRMKRTADFIAAVKAMVEEDRCMMVKEIAEAFDIGIATVDRVLHDDLGLSKKSERWVPKLLNEEKSCSDEYLAKKAMNFLSHAPYTPDIAPADF